MIVVFFSSAAARAIAPSSPMPVSAAVQHPRPEPSQRHRSARRGARTRVGADAGRASAARGARLRTFEVDRRDRRVLLEQGRESSRMVVADVVVCGGAAPRTRVSVTIQRGSARKALAHARGRRQPGRALPEARARASALSASGACAAAAVCPSAPTPSIPGHRARSRTSEVDGRGPLFDCFEFIIYDLFGDEGVLRLHLTRQAQREDRWAASDGPHRAPARRPRPCAQAPQPSRPWPLSTIAHLVGINSSHLEKPVPRRRPAFRVKGVLEVRRKGSDAVSVTRKLR